MSANSRIHIALLIAVLSSVGAQHESKAQVPDAPSDTDVIVIRENSIDVIWVDNSNNELAFDVFRSDAGGPSRLLGAVDANLTLFQDRASGIVPNVEYCYFVQARNAAGSSDASNRACVIVPPIPTAPTDLVASRLNNNSPVVLNWSLNSSNENGFLVYRDVKDTGNFVLEDTVDAGTTSFTDLMIRTSGRFCYFVTAFNTSGESDRTNISCVDVVVGDPTLPTFFITEPLSGNSISVTWDFGLVTHDEQVLERFVPSFVIKITDTD
jgi:hypothetical protein